MPALPAPAVSRATRRIEAAPLPSLDLALRHLIAIGAVLVLLIPAARGMHPSLGWLPLWFIGMPLCAWAALRWAESRRSGFSRERIIKVRSRLKPLLRGGGVRTTRRPNARVPASPRAA